MSKGSTKAKIAAIVVVAVGLFGALRTAPSTGFTSEYLKVRSTSDSAISWESMDHAMRIEYMKAVVLPKMKAEFIAFDSSKFSNFNCITCHGSGAKNGSFKMPNPEIFKMPNSKEGWAKADPKFLKFMKEKVKPDMAKLLGQKPFDMQTKTGFGCGNCHTDQE